MATEEQRKKEAFLQDVRLGNPACLAVWQEFGYSASSTSLRYETLKKLYKRLQVVWSHKQASV